MSDSIPVNAAELGKVKTKIVEITSYLQQMDNLREDIKTAAADIEDEFGIKKKLVNKIARTMYKHNYADLQTENEHFEYLYEAIAEGKKVGDQS